MTHTAWLEVAEVTAACPECAASKPTAETLRVHRWLAHGIQELPKPEYPKAS